MKKTGILFIILATLLLAAALIIASRTAVAQESLPTYEQVQQIGEKIPSSPEQTAEIGKAYLKQEWTKLLEKYPLGRVLLAISGALSALDFYWLPVLGIPYSLSWEFIFGIMLLLIISNIVYGVMYGFFEKRWMAIVGGLLVGSLVGTTGVIKKGLDLLTFAINNVWIASTSLVIAILIMALIVQFSGKFRKWMKEQQRQEKVRKTEEAEEKIRIMGKVAEEELKGYSGKK